jgi:cyclopropane fatty-acyl-phospholipid synthase-like methyltransferase
LTNGGTRGRMRKSGGKRELRIEECEVNDLMMDEQELDRRFPRGSQYNWEWVQEGSMGSHALWMAEWLCERLDLRPGMRVLDLGCGKAKSSIFMAREFGVEVWATDLWIAASENWQRIRDAGLENRVFPLHADARALPFAAEFFDAMTALDCYSYFGTDSLYLNYLAQFVKPGGQLGIAGAGLVQEISGPVPDHLQPMWSQDLWALHSAAWWQDHWQRTGLVEVETADSMSEGWRLWSTWQRQAWPDNIVEIETVERDAGRFLTYIRMVGRRCKNVALEEYAWPDTTRSMPVRYDPKPMFKEAEG